MKNALVAWLLLVAACAAGAQDLDKPLLLVAAPDLQGPYSHTALLVVPQRGQHIGFILNRATGVKLATLFPEHAPSAKVADPVYFGGPERTNTIFAVLPRDPDAAVVFSKDTGDDMWGMLLKRFGKRPELPAGMRGA